MTAQRENRWGRLIVFLTLGLAGFGGCASAPRFPVVRQTGESVVLVGEEPAHLSQAPLPTEPIQARNSYLPSRVTVEYFPGRDFILDARDGTLRRTPGSRIPDFQTNVLFGKEMFDHSRYPGLGNGKYFVYLDYSFEATNQWPAQASQTPFLKVTHGKLARGRAVKIVAFGDSITAGGNASQPSLIFWQRWADELQRKYPQARVTALNRATGGDATEQGLQRLQAKVLDEKPDLALIGFGMNDNNINGVPLPKFKANLKEMVARIRNQTGAEIILFSAFPPNPRWKFGSAHMAEYAEATRQAAAETGCAYADVYDNWQALARRKKPEDLLDNDINHPNDFGHWIYYRVLCQLGL